MKKVICVLTIILLSATSSSLFAQLVRRGYIVNYVSRNHSALIVSASDGTTSHVFNSVGTSYVFSGTPTSMTFGHNYTIWPGWSTGGYYIPSLPYNTPVDVISNSCEKLTITKQPGYSVIGATYDFVINIEAYQYCL